MKTQVIDSLLIFFMLVCLVGSFVVVAALGSGAGVVFGWW